MIRITQDEWRRAFSAWLRTGRVPVQRADEAELKFNPWHDPDDGRFTFAGAGVYYGRGSSRSGDKPRRPARPKAGRRRPPKVDGFRGGGGGNGGGGGGGTWEPSSPESRRASSRLLADAPFDGTTRPTDGAGKPSEKFRKVFQNGYTYAIDMNGRTRRVTGILVFSLPIRSRAAQAQAGGADRRSTDDGGHYIAARFNGPTDAFNHFAQDANFNRGGYRALEQQWAREMKAGKSVTVRIVPYYDRGSTRPYEIDVWFTIDGHLESQKFPNERSEKRRGNH
jgi:hypothetical protein